MALLTITMTNPVTGIDEIFTIKPQYNRIIQEKEKKPMLNTTITSKSVLAKLTIAMWSARVQDVQSVEKLSAEYNASTNQIGVAKLLLSKDRFKNMKDIANRARKLHRNMTLPWDTEGYSLLITRRYDDYNRVMKELKESFESETEAFLHDYEAFIETDRQLLGTMVEPEEYPAKETLEKKFKFEYHFMPVPQEDDFRLAIDDDTVQAIMQNCSGAINSRIDNIKSFLYNKLYASVKHAIEKLDDTHAWFKDVTLQDIINFGKEIKDLNVMEDPDLDRMAYKAQHLIEQAAPTLDDIRKDESVRVDLSLELEKIREQLLSSGVIENE
jgi:hypothetical protein